MYLQHYGLTQKPFDISPDPSFLWRGEKHQEGLAILKYGILENKGFLLITGDVGTGKTALIRTIEKEVQANAIIVTIPDPGLELIDFYNFLASELNMGCTFTSKAEFLIQFKRLLLSSYTAQKRVLLIVDESQRLSHNLLEEIRLLSNIDLEGKVLVNIFFVGQSEFRQLLAKDENRSVRQRITVSYHIQPLTENETLQYIQHRLKVAGAKGAIFSADAVQAVFGSTRGYPRLINIVCDHALMTGYARGTTTVGRDIIEECTNELRVTMGLEIPAAAAHAPTAVPVPQPLPELQAVSGPKAMRGLLVLAGCMALVVAAWLVWGDGISDTVAKWGKRPETQAVADPTAATEAFVSSPAPLLPVQPGDRALKPAEPEAQPKTRIQAQSPPKPVSTARPETQAPASTPQAAEPTKLAQAPSPAPPAALAGPAAQPAAAPASMASPPAQPEQSEFIIYFTISSTEIPIYAQETLTGIARRLDESPRMTAAIEGHTDAIGDPAFNQAISESRAAGVKSFLTDKGVAPARLRTVGMGAGVPLETNDTPQGRSRNRRVVVRLQESR